jgi:uracil-DNA glycosylase family protein
VSNGALIIPDKRISGERKPMSPIPVWPALCAQRATTKGEERTMAQPAHVHTASEKGRAPADEVSTGSAADFMPPAPTLPSLRKAAAGCRGCRLWTIGTQTVFGEGPATARVLLVGEQPGDSEDREGRPFVGPAGRLLDSALDTAGIARDDVYVTNAVKHFKWEKREGTKRRIHKKPGDREIRACYPWLDAEMALLHPEIIVCLGATAAQAILGKDFRVTQQRGRPIETDRGATVFATVHPSAVLRAPPEQRESAQRDFFADLRAVGQHLAAKSERAVPARAADREVPRPPVAAGDLARQRKPDADGRPRTRPERRPRGSA